MASYVNVVAGSKLPNGVGGGTMITGGTRCVSRLLGARAPPLDTPSPCCGAQASGGSGRPRAARAIAGSLVTAEPLETEMDKDLERMSREELIHETKKLRDGVRAHRDTTQHDLCWHHPALWALLPEKTDPLPAVPDWPQFLEGCVRYRRSLDEHLPDAPRTTELYRLPEERDAAAIRDLIESWARAVRGRDLPGILTNHSPDILMFDVPPPLHSRGIDAYRKTWDLFFSWSEAPVIFDIQEIHVTAGRDVAFAAALMRCSGTEPSGERIRLEFRLTVGLRKTGGRWTVVHEHHSVPAT
jgi:uncharacterized protein (TIGR02246 family)